MIRSTFPLLRVVLLPYSALLVLYLLVVGGGGAWLYLQAREARTEVLTQDLLKRVGPLVARLDGEDAIALMRHPQPWLTEMVSALYVSLPGLRQVSVRDPERGYGLRQTADGRLRTVALAPLGAQGPPAPGDRPPAQRLHSESNPTFVLHFDLSRPAGSVRSLELAFSRMALLERIDEAMSSLIQAIALFGGAGGLSILVAFSLALYAGRTTRRIEAHFQEIYRLATVAELTAALVHDLRNPLASLRANLKALLITPEQTPQIVQEMDQDLLRLDRKLGAILDLTRPRDEAFETVDLREVLQDAARLAKPVLSRGGLRLEQDIPPDLPRVDAMPQALCDAVLNLLINAAQSGQRHGAVVLRVRVTEGRVEIYVEDRGAGIPAPARDRVFEPFYTSKAQGHGLGLAMVKRIAAVHNGAVRAENRASGGARFVLTLPLRHTEPPSWWKARRQDSPT